MAKLYDKSSRKATSPVDAASLLSTIETFLKGSKRPVVVERGDDPLPVVPGQYLLESISGKVRLEIWGDERSVSRRVLSAQPTSPGVLDCTISQFGGQVGTLAILDLDRPQTAHRSQRAGRDVFTSRFQRMLQRQFPGWDVCTLTSSKDLQRSFSTCFPRAELTRGNRTIVACACPAPECEPEFLSAAILWHQFVALKLRPGLPAAHLALFLPEKAGTLTAHRLRWLKGEVLSPQLFLFNEHGMAGEVNAADLGNLDTRVVSRYATPEIAPEVKSLLSRLLRIEGVSCCPEVHGSLSIRSRGLEFARFENGRVFLGLDEKKIVAADQLQRVEEFAALLPNLHGPAGGQNPVIPAFPERWFESAVRTHLQLIDPRLKTTPVHGQVLTLAGAKRELLDLLAVDVSGRLSVIELKASQDIQFPMQALDYWAQIRRHAERNELCHLFPEMRLLTLPPRLLLVAPAFAFHPANEIVLRYFSPDIDVERVGVNTDWQDGLKVLFRLKGASIPISHQSSYEFDSPHQH